MHGLGNAMKGKLSEVKLSSKGCCMLQPAMVRTLREPIGELSVKGSGLLSLEAVSKGGQILSSPKKQYRFQTEKGPCAVLWVRLAG